MNVLVVDDSKTHAYIVAEMLKEANHQVMVAQDGREALGLLSRHPIQLLMLDGSAKNTPNLIVISSWLPLKAGVITCWRD